MFDCFKLKLKDENIYPKAVYSVYCNGESGFSIYRGVFELEEDAKQYCIANADKQYMYLSQTLQLPSSDDTWSWPNYAYPVFYKNLQNNISYTYSFCFVLATDAEKFENEQTNEYAIFGYSNQFYYPAGTYPLSKNKSTIFKSIAPYEVIEIPPISTP